LPISIFFCLFVVAILKALIYISIFLLTGSFASAQSNLDFERWDIKSNGTDVAADWMNTTDASSYGAPKNVTKEVENPAEGLASLQLNTVYWEKGTNYNLDTLVGALVQRMDYTEKPKSFSFLYKAFPKKGDAILVGVQLTAIVDGEKQVVAEGFFTDNKKQKSWKYQKVKIEYFSDVAPSQMSVLALSSANVTLEDGSNGTSKIGSSLFLDEININSARISFEEEATPNYYLDVFPNPASSYINIDTNNPDAQKIEIFNLSGQLVLSQYISNKTKSIVDISSIQSGTYIYKITGAGKVITTNKFSVVK